MFLEKIELHGFKSFANRTIIAFPKPKNKKNHGITAIIGPNGSGKSNIIDALRWVLGEQSTKTLRGKKAADVIFSGTPEKARMGMTEVTLFFNNQEQLAPVDYQEIVITRRLYRDGESEYILNNTKTRLQDIIMLLARCNVGQKSYSIIGQGMITEIINSTPNERKLFFDEATGIRPYQIQRDQAINKLERTHDNLNQSENIIKELAPRLRLLKRQISKLEQRKTIEQELRENQSNYYGALWNNILSEKIRFNEEKAVQEKEFKIEETLHENLQTKLNLLSENSSRTSLYTNLQSAYNELIFGKNKLTQELATIKGKTNIEYTKIGKQNISWLELKEDEIIHKIEITKQELEQLFEQTRILETKLQRELSLQKELIETFERIDTALIQAQRDDQQGFIYKNTHIKTLLGKKDLFPGLIGTVSELGTASKDYTRALEVTAGSYMEAIIANNEDTVRDCIRFLRQNRLGTATFLPITKIKPRSTPDIDMMNDPGIFGWAINLVNFDKTYFSIFSFIFSTTIIIDHIETAKKIGIGNVRMVTLEGDLLEKGGVIKGGFRRYRSEFTFRTPSMIEILSTDKLAELENKRIEIIHSKKEIETNINKLRIEIEIQKSKQSLHTTTIRSLENELTSIQREINEQEASPEERNNILQECIAQKEAIQQKIESLDLTINEQRQKINAFNTEEELKKQELFSLQQKIQEQNTKITTITKKVTECSIQITRIETKQEDLTRELTEELGDNFISHLSQTQKDISLETVYTRIRELKQLLNSIGTIDPEIVHEYNETQERYTFLEIQINDLKKALEHTEKIINELDILIKKQFTNSFKKINHSFNHFFTKLFGSGKAQLEIIQETQEENEDDPQNESSSNNKQSDKKITTGIEIMASPSHKKITNMNMMSGGEKTMTAIALIVAIISNNASPFVFLDEVDAALDETNSQKFGEILSEIAQITQCILITHNRVLMHEADILYGVTMGGDGTTRVLSLNINEAETIDQAVV